MATIATVCRRLWKKLMLNDTQVRLENCRATTAQRLSRILSPFETYVISFQSILIWERPYISAVVLIFCNWLFFWVTTVLKFKLYGILVTFAFIVYLYRVILFDVLPEIKLPPTEGEDTEEWTPVNPLVLSVPEISQYMDDLLKWLKNWNEWLMKFRSTNPGLFCLGGCLAFSIFAFLGHIVPGIIIAYIILLTIITGPGVIFHVIPRAKLNTILSYLFSRPLDNSSSCKENDELEDFIPKINEDHLADLELPMKSDDGPEESAPFLGCPPIEDGNITPSLTSGMSFPDPTDSSEDEFLPSDLQTQNQNGEEMRFVPTHFNGSNSSKEGSPVDPSTVLNSTIASTVISNLLSSTLSSLQTSNTSRAVRQRHRRAESDTSEDSSGFVIVDDELSDFSPET